MGEVSAIVGTNGQRQGAKARHLERGEFRLKAPNRKPESDLQRQVATMLRAYLPDDVWFSASLSGVRLSPAIAGQAKAAGMEKGAPDLSFVWPTGETTYCELKAASGSLTPEQRALASTLGSAFVVCRSWPQVKDALEHWMAPHGLRFLTETESLRREVARRRGA